MYKALKTFYILSACFSYDNRRKIANVFTLTLEPHGAKMNEDVDAIAKPIRQSDRSPKREIKGYSEFVCVFIMTFTGDMPQ